MTKQTFFWQKTCWFQKHARALCLYCSNDAALLNLLLHCFQQPCICSRSGNIAGLRFLRIPLSCASFLFPFLLKTEPWYWSYYYLNTSSAADYKYFPTQSWGFSFLEKRLPKHNLTWAKASKAPSKTWRTPQHKNQHLQNFTHVTVATVLGKKRRTTMDLTCWLK